MEWKEESNKLKKTFKFGSFKEAMSFMVRASYEIENINHHPEWTNVYDTVNVELCTHDDGNVVTEKDRKLAAILDDLYWGEK